MTGSALAEHWDGIYRQRAPTELTWYQRQPRVSLDLLDALGVTPDQAVVDVGGGTSTLAAHLVERGFGDVTVLDLSAAALAAAAESMGERGGEVHWLEQDVLTWRPERHYQAWHDRAVFHFLVDEARRLAYLATLRAALDGGGAVVVGTFAADGPQQCSGLPVCRYAPEDLASEDGILGAVVGSSVGAALGAHVANGRRGSLWLSMLASAVAQGLYTYAITRDPLDGRRFAVVLGIPLVGMATSVAVERITSR